MLKQTKTRHFLTKRISSMDQLADDSPLIIDGGKNWWGSHQEIHDVSHAVQENNTWECSLTVQSVNHIKGAPAMLRKVRQMRYLLFVQRQES